MVGPISFGPDGEWAESVIYFEQFHDVTDGSLQQFRDLTHEAIVWPPDKKTGELIYPYSAAKKP